MAVKSMKLITFQVPSLLIWNVTLRFPADLGMDGIRSHRWMPLPPRLERLG
jgi:hypothetical protein